MKLLFRCRLWVILPILVFTSCENSKKADCNKFIANYERDKFIPSDTTGESNHKTENSGGWTISLGAENSFVFKGTGKIIKGFWTIDAVEDENYYLKLRYNNDSSGCKINGNIIYFARPEKLFDSLFSDVIFVKTTRNTE